MTAMGGVSEFAVSVVFFFSVGPLIVFFLAVDLRPPPKTASGLPRGEARCGGTPSPRRWSHDTSPDARRVAILNAFGTAWRLRHNNVSRFGKFIGLRGEAKRPTVATPSRCGGNRSGRTR